VGNLRHRWLKGFSLWALMLRTENVRSLGNGLSSEQGFGDRSAPYVSCWRSDDAVATMLEFVK
jgi:hypothetical protein